MNKTWLSAFAVLLGAATMIPGCGGASIQDACEHACDCDKNCSAKDEADCESQGAAAQVIAQKAGCTSQFDDVASCTAAATCRAGQIADRRLRGRGRRLQQVHRQLRLRRRQPPHLRRQRRQHRRPRRPARRQHRIERRQRRIERREHLRSGDLPLRPVHQPKHDEHLDRLERHGLHRPGALRVELHPQRELRRPQRPRSAGRPELLDLRERLLELTDLSSPDSESRNDRLSR